MRVHRFIVSFSIKDSLITISDPPQVHQMRDVLALAVGERVVLSDGKGLEIEGVIVDITKKAVVVEVETEKKLAQPKKEVNVYCAILKHDNFEWVVQKATEVGATKIVPLITDRTIKTGIQRARLERIIVEAAEQSGRSALPVLAEPVKFTDALGVVGTRIFFDMCDEAISKKDFLEKQINVFIGPEGGWDARERELAENNGFLVRSLGGTVLRAETAATVAVYMAAQM